MSDPSWLDIANPVVIAAPRKAPRTIDREATARAMRRLTPFQRLYLQALADHGMNAWAANKALRLENKRVPSTKTIGVWKRNPDYALMKRFYAQDALTDMNVDATAILLRAARMVDFNSEEVDEMNQGKPTGMTKMRDAGIALRAIELLGKKEKLWGDAQEATRVGPTLVVQIISRDGTVLTPNSVINGECVVVSDLEEKDHVE